MSYLAHATKDCLVLLDTGATEVVRSFNMWEWQQIERRRPFKRKVCVGLAMNNSVEAGITMGGELMRAPSRNGIGPRNCHWICPISRCRK